MYIKILHGLPNLLTAKLAEKTKKIIIANVYV